MVQYSIIQRVMHAENVRTKLTFKPDEDQFGKFKKTLQYMSRLISKELEDYSSTSQEHQDLPNAPTTANISKLIDFLTKIDALEGEPILTGKDAWIENTSSESMKVNRSIGLAKGDTIPTGYEPLMIDVTPKIRLKSYWRKAQATEYDADITVMNADMTVAVEKGLSIKPQRESWVLLEKNRTREALILDFKRVLKGTRQGKGYTFNYLVNKPFAGFTYYYWDFVWAVYRFAELVLNNEGWGTEWAQTIEEYKAKNPSGAQKLEDNPINLQQELNFFFRYIIRDGTNFSKKGLNLKYGVHPVVRLHIEKLLMYYYRDEINIQLTNAYDKSSESTRASAFETKKYINNEKLALMKDNYFLRTQGFKYVEVDNDVDIADFDIVQQEWNILMQLLPNFDNTPTLNIPTLRFRKLGNYRAGGIYGPSLNTIAVDLISAFIHEYGHMIDYQLKTSKSEQINAGLLGFNKDSKYIAHTLSLSSHFNVLLTKYQELLTKEGVNQYKPAKLNYYKTPTEVFARSFEWYLRSKGLQSHLLGSIEGKDREGFERVEYSVFNNTELNQEIQKYFDALYVNELGITSEALIAKIAIANAAIKELGVIKAIQDTEIEEREKDENSTDDSQGVRQESEVRPEVYLNFKNQLRRKTFEDLLIEFDDYCDAGYTPVLTYDISTDNNITFQVISNEIDVEQSKTTLEPWVQDMFRKNYDYGVTSRERIPTLAIKFIVAFNKYNHTLK